jgi:hypothetical protein
LLSEATWQVVEKSLAARDTKKKVWSDAAGWQIEPGSAWGLDDQFEFEVSVSATDATGRRQQFPDDPFTLQENVRIVLRALKPAHTLYSYRHLFTETFGALFNSTSSWRLTTYYYEDLRKFCCGAKWVTGTGGITWTDRALFSDPARDFSQISPGATLRITSGQNNKGQFRVVEIRTFPVGTDTTARSYTTSPTGLTGTATVSGSDVEDPSQNFGTAVEGETITFATGPNAGTYRLKTLLGNTGGPVGQVVGPASRVRIAPSLLRLDRRMRYATTGQSYTVVVDRLGIQVPQAVAMEDATLYFVL